MDGQGNAMNVPAGTGANGTAMNGARTVIQALRWAQEQWLREAPTAGDSSETARLRDVAHFEAEVLFMHASGWTRTQLVTSLQEPVPEGIMERFEPAVKQRLERIPLQYITGEAFFYGRAFAVRPGCLIPRPETEVLVDEAAKWVNALCPDAAILDVGTGSGAIAVTMQLECPQSAVYAVDISADALAIAKDNSDRLQAPVRFIQGDGFRLLQDLAIRQADELPLLNVVVSNPPYIPSADVLALDEEVRGHEPRLALDGGQDGLDFYRAIASVGDTAFCPGPAAVFLEVGMGQAKDVIGLFEEDANAKWARWEFDAVADLRGIERVVRGRRRA